MMVAEIPTLAEVDVRVDGPYARRGLRTFRVADDYLGRPLARLLDLLPGAGIWAVDDLSTEPALRDLGWFASRVFGAPSPLAAVVQRDLAQPIHVDRGLLVSVILAHNGVGAALVFPDERVAVDTVDGLAVMFDGSRAHGLTDWLTVEGGYRFQVAYRCTDTI